MFALPRPSSAARESSLTGIPVLAYASRSRVISKSDHGLAFDLSPSVQQRLRTAGSVRPNRAAISLLVAAPYIARTIPSSSFVHFTGPPLCTRTTGRLPWRAAHPR
jgi:hypothetical protein